MKKYIAKFKSGNSVKIPEIVVEAIRDGKGSDNPVKRIQCNTITDDSGTRMLIINLDEIDYIASIEDLA